MDLFFKVRVFVPIDTYVKALPDIHQKSFSGAENNLITTIFTTPSGLSTRRDASTLKQSLSCLPIDGVAF